MTERPWEVSDSGGSIAPSKSELIKAAHLILDNTGVDMGTRKVFRLVDNFKERAPNANGYIFFQYLASAVQLSAEQQRAALRNPDIARAICYADPTGETAVNRVMKARAKTYGPQE